MGENRSLCGGGSREALRGDARRRGFRAAHRPGDGGAERDRAHARSQAPPGDGAGSAAQSRRLARVQLRLQGCGRREAGIDLRRCHRRAAGRSQPGTVRSQPGGDDAAAAAAGADARSHDPRFVRAGLSLGDARVRSCRAHRPAADAVRVDRLRAAVVGLDASAAAPDRRRARGRAESRPRVPLAVGGPAEVRRQPHGARRRGRPARPDRAGARSGPQDGAEASG